MKNHRIPSPLPHRRHGPRIAPKRVYRLEMGAAAFYALLVLLIASGYVLFQLGVVLGMASRRPANPAFPEYLSQARPSAAAPVPTEAAPAPPSLVTESTSPQKPPGAIEERYTVQVFASQKRAAADSLKARLLKQGFQAYSERFYTASGTAWYRVRVGKNSRTAADALAIRLRTQAKLQETQVIQLPSDAAE